MSRNNSEEKPPRSPLWHRAIDRYREELDENDDYQSITEIGSLEELLDSTKSIEPLLPSERNALSSMQRIGPTLKFVDDFSAVIAVCFGADPKLTAFVWGSIRLVLSLASSAGDTLKDVLEMLEDLSLTLPRFRAYETNLPMDRALEAALVDVYTEVICFYARCIRFFRTHPHVLLRRNAWQDFRNDFSRTVRRIRRLSATVEREAESARMMHLNDRGKYDDVLSLMETLKEAKIRQVEAAQYYYIPSEASPRFWGREDALEAIQDALKPDEKPFLLKTFALYGMGGVGKTQIALQYALRNRDCYQAILWVTADNAINMGQSFREIAKLLGLIETEEELQDTVGATRKVKNWLTDTNCPWLVIFDNADDLEVLRHVWPANGQGSILLTTRNASATHSPACAGMQVQPFDDADGSQVLLKLVGLDVSLPENQKLAAPIARVLGGLPLALNQIGGFIVQRKLPLQDFLPLYERNSAKIDARKMGIGDREHTLSTVWNMSMSKASGDSRMLLNILPYFQPDEIDEAIFHQGARLLNDVEFNFLGDKMDLGDAEEVLLKTGLIDKNPTNAVLRIHRLIQAATVRTQNDTDRERYFNAVVCILSWGFPDTWSEDVGHQFQAWANCEKCLPHVRHLVATREKYKIDISDSQSYGELLLRCSWYMYERECYDIANSMIQAALDTFKDRTTLAFASAIDLSGLINLDISHPNKALAPFREALEVRKQRLGSTDPLIASSLNNIALAYTELVDLDKAYATHSEAITIRLNAQSDRIGNSYSNMSSLLLRMKKPDDAEEILKRCPSLQDFTDETFLKTRNPRFSGDMVLLSRIRVQQGRLDEAFRLASKALAFRQRMCGNRLKTCDSLYDVAGLMHRQGSSASAIGLLGQLVDISSSIPEGQGQLARAYFKLAVIHKERDRSEQSRTYRQKAEAIRADIRPDLCNAPFDETEFMKLCLWMLW
ncbi:TPR-like protein [Lindgomyces ingoldianus]|uniref:TPR-like protein n=1 Tax=Lindgomyces ingoldianus TaxID=673940 RepID=A0ACB6REF0_9PLEO|nr:TPR-like protein [Lindgomyces ingoldianus]KAF2477128.1 TPR-like protein [Lindgomyces ingoldianus]